LTLRSEPQTSQGRSFCCWDCGPILCKTSPTSPVGTCWVCYQTNTKDQSIKKLKEPFTQPQKEQSKKQNENMNVELCC
jgi:hypothetical protein